MKDEALRLALEALSTSMYPQPRQLNAIAAIKQALEQPEPEPVAWRYRMPVEDGHWVWNYATYIDDPKDQRCEPLYTTPPKREWQVLTDEEYSQLHDGLYQQGKSLGWVVDQIEEKLKKRNA